MRNLSINLILIIVLLIVTTTQTSNTIGQSGIVYTEIVQVSRGTAEAIAWNKNSDVIAVGGNNAYIWLYSDTLTDIAKIQLSDPSAHTFNMQWSPDGTQLAIDTNNGTSTAIEVWNVDTVGGAYQLASLIPSESLLTAGQTTAISWNPNPPIGVNQIAITNDNTFEIEIWEVTTSTSSMIKQWEPTGFFISSLAWSPDGAMIASSHLDDDVHIWEVSSTNLIGTLSPTGNSYFSLAWNSDSTKIAGYNDNEVLIWDIINSQPIISLQGHDGIIYDIEWDDNGFLSSSSWDGTTRIWDIGTQSTIAVFSNQSYRAADVSWNSSGTQVVTAESSTLKVWDIGTQSTIASNMEYSLPFKNFSFSPDGLEIATIPNSPINGNTIQIWDASDGTHIVDLPQIHTGQITDIAWSPDGTMIASSQDNERIIIWDAVQHIFIKEILGYGGVLSWSPDSNYLATSWNNTTITLDINSSNQVASFNGEISRNSWSPDGSSLVGISTSGSDRSIHIWDADTGIPTESISTNEVPFSVVWSNDGSKIVNGTEKGVIQVWDADTTNFVREITGHSQLTIANLDYHPNLDIIISSSVSDLAGESGNEIRLWDVNTGNLLDTIQTDQAELSHVEWSIGGNIAYVSISGILKIWGEESSSIVCDYDIPTADTATLISTITTANGSGNPTTICLAQDSTYTFTTANNYLNAMPYITGDITIEGNNATVTRSGTEAFRFFEVETGGKLTLNNLTLSNGDVTGETERGGALMNDGGETTLNNVTFDGNVGVTGGALDNEEGTVTINDSTFINNGGGYGGAIDNDATATMVIIGSSFTTNQALFDGGAIHNDGGTLTVSSTTFTTNTAEDYGGAIDNDDGDLTINASTFTSNSSDGGGAIRNDSSTTLTINAGTAFNNNAANNLGWGGAIYNKSGTTVVVNGTSFSGNTANLEGGAIRNQGNLTVNTGSTFDGNTAAEYGGAIYNTGGTVNLTGVDIINNTATAKDAGGVYGNSSSSLTITDSTLDGNDSGRRGGGIWSSGTASLTNAYITNNTAVVEGGGIYGSSSATISAGNSCITGNTSRAAYSASSSNQIFENNWWGATNGPSGSGSGSGDAVNSKIDYTPFITTSCPLP